MKLTLAAWRAQQAEVARSLPIFPELARDERDWEIATRELMRVGKVMSGPLDPAHDPCGRPPLPRTEVHDG